MYKKMLAEIKENGDIVKVYKRKVCGSLKPVWVTDRDPFENVRDVLAHFENEGEDNQLIGALKKDLKNWDEGTKKLEEKCKSK